MWCLAAIRLSRLTDASTSPARQREVTTAWADQHGGTIVGEAVDLDVSGSVNPFERDGLGPWLTDRPSGPWDVLVAWRLDRVSRSALDTLTLLEWLEARGKRLVTVADGIDTGTSMGRLFVQIAGIFAQLERETIRERVIASRAALRASGRWGGEAVHYGYKATPADGGGYRLELDAEAADELRAMYDAVLAGWSVAQITRDLNARGVPAPRDRQRQLRGQPTKGDRWAESTVWGLLASRAALGWTVHGGEADPSLPKAPPAVSAGVFDRVQTELAKRRKSKTRNPGANSAPLSGVAVCWECMEPLWHRAQHVPAGRGRQKTPTTYRYYHCKTKGHTRQIRADKLEALALKTFIAAHGDTEVEEPVSRPATEASEERAALSVAIDDLTGRMAAARSSGVRAALADQLAELDDRLAELEGVDDDPGGVDLVPTGRLWRDEIARLGEADRRALWIRTGWRFAAQRTEEDVRVAIIARPWSAG